MRLDLAVRPSVRLLAPCALALAACGEPEPPREPGAPATHAAARPDYAGIPLSAAPEEVRRCATCHATVVDAWLGNGMANALGPIPDAIHAAASDSAWVANPRSGFEYRVAAAADDALRLERRGPAPTVLPSLGPHRTEQPLHWRIGAGVAAMSFVALESERWTFAPLEHFRGHGFVLSPSEERPEPSGLTRPVTDECLGCHTSAPLPVRYPRHEFGAAEPRGISCAACHGDSTAHLAKMALPPEDYDGQSAIVNPALLPAERELDVCARCHLQGDARIELAPPSAPPFRPGEDLLARRPVFVAAHPDDDFGFVSQTERLALSACFVASPEMRCTTCHDPHLSPRDQGLESFRRACLGCHEAPHAALPDPVAGDDCLGCHMRRSQPFDLGHVAVTDHWIRRAPPPAESGLPIRELETKDGAIERFRYRTSDASPFSEREERALEAMATMHLGSAARAAPGFADWPAPGTAAARRAADDEDAPWPLAESALLHFQRARTFELLGDDESAIRAYQDALALDAAMPEARLNLASAFARTGELDRARSEALRLTERHPRPDRAWNVLASTAARAGDPQAVASALRVSLRLHPRQPATWRALSQALGQIGDPSGATDAARRAWSLDPFLPPPR